MFAVSIGVGGDLCWRLAAFAAELYQEDRVEGQVMKPNDKAYQAAIAEGKRWKVGEKFPRWKVLRQDENQYGYDVIAEFNNREDRDEALERLRAEAMVNAAYAAQFKSEDYAGLIKLLRFMHKQIASEIESDDPCGIVEETIPGKAADALDAVLAERDAAIEERDKSEIRHYSDCAVNNEPAFPAGECDCGGYTLEKEAMRLTKENLKLLDENARLIEERDALLARLAPVEDKALVEFSKHKNWELKYKQPLYCDDRDQEKCWVVYEMTGSINDREWEPIGKGETAAEAIADALKHER